MFDNRSPKDAAWKTAFFYICYFLYEEHPRAKKIQSEVSQVKWSHMPIFSYFWAFSNWLKNSKGGSCLRPFNKISRRRAIVTVIKQEKHRQVHSFVLFPKNSSMRKNQTMQFLLANKVTPLCTFLAPRVVAYEGVDCIYFLTQWKINLSIQWTNQQIWLPNTCTCRPLLAICMDR